MTTCQECDHPAFRHKAEAMPNQHGVLTVFLFCQVIGKAATQCDCLGAKLPDKWWPSPRVIKEAKPDE